MHTRARKNPGPVDLGVEPVGIKAKSQLVVVFGSIAVYKSEKKHGVLSAAIDSRRSRLDSERLSNVRRINLT